MITKKVLLGSLSFVIVSISGNVVGAIAQVADRYLSDQEIQSLEADFQAAALGASRVRAYTDIRSSSEINQFNAFVNAWGKADSSIAPFLGTWQGWEESYSFYPSQTKGQICAVLTFYDGRGARHKFNVGKVSGDKLSVDGDSGKTIFVRRKGGLLRKQAGVSVPDQDTDIVAQYTTFGGRQLVFTYIFPTRLQEVRDNRFEKFGCTTSLPSLSNSIPSVPPSSTPVKPTDTITKYPTNDDFNSFEDKLQGNPENLVKLRGNQAEQRRKFQNDWKDRNPNAAKFLGSWYTDNRYFYVFPSTAKSRTCVVTQNANGKLDMQIGNVLNQELRYGGDKGFFWRERENIVASRDSGSGSLYPIYATSAIPELPESIIGDMERQKCITTLPFEADAQYYKERGDKFAKLGKKDEAISNYRKALEVLRKQNLFAQIRTIESLIANLSDKHLSKPITQKPVDTIYSGTSPLYEDVDEPNYKPDKGVTPTFRVGLNAFEVVDNGQTVQLNSRVKAKAPTIIITHGLDNDLTSAEFRNLLKAVKYNSSVQVLVVDWSQGSKTNKNVRLAASRIEVSASKVVDLIEKYNLDPSNISLIGHSLGAHLSVEVALEIKKRSSGNLKLKSITLLDPAVDLPLGYTVKELSNINQSTFIRAFYTSGFGSSSFAASANESYNIQFQSSRDPFSAHGESMTLLANSFQGDSNRKRNCIAEQFIKLSEKFAGIPQNTTRERPASGTKPSTDLYVAYDSNRWLYPVQISKNNLPMVVPVSDPKTGVKCLVVNGSEVNILK